MKQALRLAHRGLGKTSPNPMVGAVIVKNDQVVGWGYHRGKGKPHAEIMALRRVGSAAKGAILYVNLEPCCHYGATPPCTKAIIEAEVKVVHAAIVDTSPLVNGQGIKELKDAGIKVILGECGEEAEELNEAYLKFVRTGLPFVILKAGVTLDGNIATKTGESQWVTNERVRKFVHRLRSQVDAVMVGVGTVLRDNPQLTVRFVRGKNPKRIILDSNLRTPPDARVLGKDCIIATTSPHVVRGFSLAEKQEPTASKDWFGRSFRGGEGAPKKKLASSETWCIKKDKQDRVDMLEVLKKAAQSGIQSILIEGGKEVFTEALKRKIVDRVYFCIAPKMIGSGIPVTGELGIKSLKDALILSAVKFKKFGDNILVSGKVK